MSKEKYVKPKVTRQKLEAEVLTSNHGSPNGGNLTGGGGFIGWKWKKNWH